MATHHQPAKDKATYFLSGAENKTFYWRYFGAICTTAIIVSTGQIFYDMLTERNAGKTQDTILGAIISTYWHPNSKTLRIEGFAADVTLGAPLSSYTVYLDGAERKIETQKATAQPPHLSLKVHPYFANSGFEILVSGVEHQPAQITIRVKNARGFQKDFKGSPGRK